MLLEVADNAVGSVTVALDVVVHPLASVTVTVYVPATSPLAVAVVAALLHAKVYGEVPPAPLAVADPSFSPLQLTFEFITADAITADEIFTTTSSEAVHPLASVTVTV